MLAANKRDSVPILPTAGVAKSSILSEVEGYIYPSTRLGALDFVIACGEQNQCNHLSGPRVKWIFPSRGHVIAKRFYVARLLSGSSDTPSPSFFETGTGHDLAPSKDLAVSFPPFYP